MRPVSPLSRDIGRILTVNFQGIPKALGTSLKRKDKERHKDKDKDKDKDKYKDLEKSYIPENEDVEYSHKLHQNDSRPSEKRPQSLLSVSQSPDDRVSDVYGPKQSRENDRQQHDIPGHHHQSGWSSVLEEWYGHGVGVAREDSPVFVQKLASPNTPVLSSTDIPNQQSRRTDAYELLEKDRLLGVYMAIYVRRDIRHLVQGRVGFTH